MTFAGEVQNAPVGTLGFDSDAIISSAVAQKFAKGGFKFCLRYVSRQTEAARDLSSDEAKRILDAGLALMPVQHVRQPGWTPSLIRGTQDGDYAARNASTIGIPKGVNLWCDLEGVAAGTAALTVRDYCNAWFDAVKAAGYQPGLYVGAQSILNEQELYEDLKFQHYWRSQSNVPNVSSRGYQMIQLFPSVTVNGVDIDINVTQDDYKGGHALWLTPSTGQPRRAPALAPRAKRPASHASDSGPGRKSRAKANRLTKG